MKTLLLINLIFYSMFLSTSYAQNNVVVVPLLGDDAAPGIAGYVSQAGQVHITSTDQVIISLGMMLPSAGKVITNVSGSTIVDTKNEAYALRCSVNKNTQSVDFSDGADFQTRMQHPTPNAPTFGPGFNYSIPFASTRGFEVNKGGVTFYLVCDLDPGQNVQVRNAQLTAMFFPNS